VDETEDGNKEVHHVIVQHIVIEQVAFFEQEETIVGWEKKKTISTFF